MIFSIEHPIKIFVKVNLRNLCLCHGIASINRDINESIQKEVVFHAIGFTQAAGYYRVTKRRQNATWCLETNSTKTRVVDENSRQATVLKV